MNTLLLEPIKYYCEAEKRHRDLVSARFEDLVKQSGIDVSENRKTAEKYREKLGEIDNVQSKIRKYKTFFWLLIVLSAAAAIAAVMLIANPTENQWIPVFFTAFAVVFLIAVIIIDVKVLRPKIKGAETTLAALMAESEVILNLANGQMAALNALFEPQDTHRLIEKTMPEIDFHKSYTPSHEKLLCEKYDYLDLADNDASIIDVLAGTLVGNPFLYERYKDHTLGKETYTGSITIHWTTTSRDSKGNVRTEHHSQILTASVTKPKPFYTVSTHLGYGCKAAPDLSFSRNESDTDELSEGALARRIRRGEKKLQSRAEKAASNGGNFQQMANTEFDVLFGAHNRNHEVQFRLMYTPLAQTNTIELLRSKVGYGDDFNFIKNGKYNVIKSLHSQSFSMNTDVTVFKSYDVDISREAFLSYNCEYFKSVFFDMAPLLAVPAYHESGETDENDFSSTANFTEYEHEALANAVGPREFAHPDTATDVILKTKLLSKTESSDTVLVTAYSYRAIPRTDIISMYGRDGRFHNVPVHWTEYIPVVASREMTLTKADTPAGDAYMHGISAVVSK